MRPTADGKYGVDAGQRVGVEFHIIDLDCGLSVCRAADRVVREQPSRRDMIYQNLVWACLDPVDSCQFWCLEQAKTSAASEANAHLA